MPTAGDSPDAGKGHSGYGGPTNAFAGPVASSKFGEDPLGPNPATPANLVDLGRDLATLASFGRAFGNPVAMALSLANSPAGRGLAKSISARTGISAATPAPEDLDSLDKPAPALSMPSVVNAIASLVGFGPPAGAGRAKGTPKSSPEEVEAAPVTAATPAAATPAAATPAAAAPVAAQDIPSPPSHMSPNEAALAGVDLGAPDAGRGGAMGNNPTGGNVTGGNFGGDANTAGGSINSEPGNTTSSGTAGLGSQASQAESNSPGAGSDAGGKGDSAGDGSNGESGAGSDAGGEKRMGGPISTNGDGRLDAVPITAHEGEFILSPEATAMVGTDLLQRINDMALQAAGHPPRPIDPQAHIQSPLSQLRAGAVPPVPGRPGSALLARPGMQGHSVYGGPLPMPGMGGARIPTPQEPPVLPLSFVSASAPPAPGGAPPLPGPPPGPFPMPPTTAMPMSEGFSENAVPYASHVMGPTEGLPMPPPAPPAPASRRAAPVGGGLTADQLNGMSLDLARGQGTPPAGGAAREAYDRIAARMQGDGARPAYRMGGLVGAPPAEELVEAGSWEWEGGDEGAAAPSALPRSSQPYAEEGMNDQPFGDDPSAPAGGPTMDDVRQRLLALPPEMQQAVAAAIGADPMVASALLQVLGPHFAPLIQAAMTAVAPPPPDPMAAVMGGGGALMQPMG